MSNQIIVDLYNEGKPVSYIKELTGHSYSNIYSILSKNKIPLRFQDGKSLKKNVLIKFLQEGKTIEEIATIKRTTVEAVNRACSRYGLNGVGLEEELSPIQEQLIYGSLLGDAYCELHHGVGRLKFDHGEKQFEYLQYKARILSNFVLTEPKLKTRLDSRSNLNRSQASFKTRTSSVFTNIHGQFYLGNLKRVTQIILNKLDDRGLAFWFMDDGFKYNQNGYGLCTDCFTSSELILIQNYFKERWKLDSKIKDNRVIFNGLEAVRFQKIVEFNILDSLQYKLL